MRFKINAQTFSHGWELPSRLTGDGGTPGGQGIPADARYKPGSGGQLLAFVPSLDLVVTRQTGSSGQWDYTEYLRRACAAVLPLKEGEDADEVQASVSKWSKIELGFTGPDSKSRGARNPFAVRLDVIFSSPGGNQVRIPGFYNGSSSGGEDGNVWNVRFSPDETGVWKYSTESSERQLANKSGSFEVTGVANDAQGFWKWGRLYYPGTSENEIRYLKFRDGPYWLKAGCDDPENFLGSYSHFDTPAKRRAAVDYLADHGSAWKQYDHERYYREIIARFGYLPAVVFNLGEEHNENYRLRDGLALAKKFKQLDPYNHPLGIHNINPKNARDGKFQGKQQLAGGQRTLTSPDKGDWALRIVSQETR